MKKEIEGMSFLMRRQMLINELTENISKETNGSVGENKFKFADLASIKKILDPLKLTYGITDIISFDQFPNELPKIYLYDLLDPRAKDPAMIFYAPVPANMFNANSFESPIQQAGACMTYYRRYLITLAYDIAATDTIDGEIPKDIVPEGVLTPKEEAALSMDQVLKGVAENENSSYENQKNMSTMSSTSVATQQTLSMENPEALLSKKEECHVGQATQEMIPSQSDQPRAMAATADESLENQILTSGKWKDQPLRNPITFGDMAWIQDTAAGLYPETDANTLSICKAYLNQRK